MRPFNAARWSSVMKLRFLLSVLVPLSFTLLIGCSSDDDCNDGTDNDGDGLIDSLDPGCAFNGNAESPDPVTTACNDGVDNDGDGLIDTSDPGCTDSLDEDEYNEPVPACQDGIDNDGDGLTDFPNDPGCDLSLKDSEDDDCPDGPNCPACSNGVDDDEDAIADYPDDPGCNHAGDGSEFNGDPSTCGSAVLIQPLPADGTAMGIIAGEQPNELISAGCGGAGEEQVYVYEPTTPRALVITTDFAETDVDTVVYIRSTCRDPLTELGCNDDDGLNVSTLVLDRVEPGEYFIVVDTQSSTSLGNYRLEVQDFTPAKEACNAAAPDCTPGMVCRRFVDSTGTAASETCELPECSDGEDSDGDGLADFPEEPGCDTPEDFTEADDCFPTVGAACPACSNNLDDDSDSLADFDPAGGGDPGCISASDNLEIDDCIPGVTITELPEAGASGTTPASGNNFTPSCDTFNSTSEDVYAFLNTRNLASLSFSTAGSVGDTVLAVRFSECSDAAQEIACDDPSSGGALATIDAPVQGEFYYAFVNGDFSSSTDYVLNVSGRIAAGLACTPGDTQFTCVDGFFCGGGSTCVATACNDMANNSDGDALVDYPNDPGCVDLNDNDETDNCPGGAGCPQCGNGTDDDGDTLVDYPDDMGCEAASDNLELDDCIAGVPLLSLADSGVTGTTEPSGNSDFEGGCSSSSTSLSSEDEYAYFNSRTLTNLTFSTVGSAGDTVLYVRQGDCGLAADEIGCADQLVSIANPDRDAFYFVFVDGDFESAMDYVLNVSGTLGMGEACSAASTQFVCDEGIGLSCSSGTCQPAQCSDGISNDADGLIDFADPGCSSAIDDNEADDPGQASECFDSTDNDMDGQTDYPADPGCEMASDNLEASSCFDSTDPVPVVTTSPVLGTTSGATDDFTPSCSSSSTANDIAHEFFFPGDLDTLTVSTDGSPFDTVLYIREATCSATDLACDDDGGVGLQSLMELTNVPAGLYYLIVDGFFSNSGAYTLSVSGVIKSGEACDDAQITAGILSCATGTSCTAGTCQ